MHFPRVVPFFLRAALLSAAATAATAQIAVTVTVSTSNNSMQAGQTATLQAIVVAPSGSSLAVTWSCSSVPASPNVCLGFSTAGAAVQPNGISINTFAAPQLISARTTVTITATSVANAGKTASTTIVLNTASQTIDIGTGAPTGGITQEFVEAFYRNGFSLLVGLPPLGQVKSLGSTPGYYYQEFPDSTATAGVKYALASASALATGGVVGGPSNYVAQIYGPEYAYYLTVGATTAGYPLSDTLACPSFDTANSCMFQVFDKNYALFVYANALISGTANFTVRQSIYTEWNSLGGVSGIGRPLTAETAVPATAKGGTATAQSFSSGAIYSITAGVAKGQVHGVAEPIYDSYLAAGGPGGTLGLPTSEVIVNTVTGLHTQTFEGGVLQYTPGGSVGTQYPVTAVNIAGATPGNTVNLNVGQTLTITATPVDAKGDLLTNLPISWASSNGQVISIAPQANSQSAVLAAVGRGSATVTASSGGVTGAPISLFVTAPCCQVGDGAPQAVQSAFQTALARNKITAQTPVAAPAARLGSGYVQMVQSGAAQPVNYLLASADQSNSAFVVGGSLLAQYQSLGGPAGALGYPVSDASAGGTQIFQNGALAGSPVQTVSGGILAKWKSLGYETGAAGTPVAAPAAFATFGANSGLSQNFANGTIYWARSGPRAGSSYFVAGLVLDAYNQAGGAGGNLGMPAGDEFVAAGVHQQNFEGGSIAYAVGVASAQVQFAPKVPAVIVAPSAISAGGTALLAVSGFANGAAIAVSVTGQPDFVVTAANGAYSWNFVVPFNASSGFLTIHAVDAKTAASATGILTIKGFDTNRVQMKQVTGNNQTGAPGALLPIPLQVAVLDAAGAPVAGALVTFDASTGAQLTVAAATTDINGQASTSVRLPDSVGITGVRASCAVAQSPVTFYAVSAATSLANFPNVQQAGSELLGRGTATIGQKGALLSSVAAILRYQQNRNAVPSPNGLADASTLNQFLTNYCGIDHAGSKICDGFLANAASGEQIVNLWRAAQFTGGLDVAVGSASLSAVADLVSQGEPVLLSLALSSNNVAAGGHFVVATGVAADGSITIQDPNPLFARTSLGDYVNGFTVAGTRWSGSLLGAVRFAVRSPSATQYLLGALSQPAALMNGLSFDVSSPAGACGQPFQTVDTVDASGHPPLSGPLVSKLQVCDGPLPAYQVSVGTPQPFHAFVIDLAPGGSMFDLSGSAPAAYQVTRPVLNLVLAPQSANFTAAGVVNAATFTSAIAPGGIISIFGNGLASPGGATTVDVDGEAAVLLSSSPFQLNVVLPPDLIPGLRTLRVASPYGSRQQQVTVSAVAPAIFLVGIPPVGAVENQDGSLNGPANPARRNQVLVVYATGLGAVTRKGPLFWADAPMTAQVNGADLPVDFAGLAPNFSGLYQVNIPIPAETVPGSVIFLTLKEGGVFSNSVSVSIQ